MFVSFAAVLGFCRKIDVSFLHNFYVLYYNEGRADKSLAL
jgi:hypothetical protein